LAGIGAVSVTVMALTCACSTPLLSYIAGVTGVCTWPLRRYMRWVRWGLVIGLVSLSLVMNAPVWYVVAHASAVEGSSGYHRAELIDTFLRNSGDWWLFGTKSNGAWGNMMFDTSNQYVNFGVTGGLLCLMSFIGIISSSFAGLGRTRRLVDGNDRWWERFLWFLGAALFVNVVAFFGISYFDQTRVAWFALLAMISAGTAKALTDTRKPARNDEIVPPVSEPEMGGVLSGWNASSETADRDLSGIWSQGPSSGRHS